MQPWLNLPNKIRWKLFRQFQSVDQITQASKSEFDRPVFKWQVLNRSTDPNATKLLLRSVDSDVQCETVALFPPARADSQRPARATACISSQPGCGVGCPFCATGSLGYQGNLTAEQIVEQVYWAGVESAACSRSLRNVVFMGMGEPLHNAQHLFQAIDWLTNPQLFGIAARRITVSTVGVPSAMLDLAKLHPGVRLALSLHSADRDQRRQLVPRALSDMQMLRATIQEINSIQDVGVWIEIVLLDGINDSLEHARLAAQFCEGLRVEVNLIPYNAHDDASLFQPATLPRREAFARHLREAGIRTSFRTSFGGSSNAACGQLRSSPITLVSR